jgi:hypothetical protein
VRFQTQSQPSVKRQRGKNMKKIPSQLFKFKFRFNFKFKTIFHFFKRNIFPPKEQTICLIFQPLSLPPPTTKNAGFSPFFILHFHFLIKDLIYFLLSEEMLWFKSTLAQSCRTYIGYIWLVLSLLPCNHP